MSTPFQLRWRLRSLVARAKGKVKEQTTQLAYEHLSLPLKEKTFQLAQEQCLAHAAQAFHVFGHTTLRNVLSNDEVSEIVTGLDEIGAGLANTDTKIMVAPVEKSRAIQKAFFSKGLLAVLQKLLPPFWYYGSDSFVGYPVFGNHRDTFLTPPFFKIFIPLVPCTFSIIPGSHCAGDRYARQVGKYVTDWDSGSILAAPVSEVHFEHSASKTISSLSHLDAEDLFKRQHLQSGDIFVFHQNLVHGLVSDIDRNFFLSITVVPSPAASVHYGLTRTQHLDKVIENIVATSVCDYQLSSQRNLDPEESLFNGYKFSEEDLALLTAGQGWHDCFGLRFVNCERWSEAFQALKHKGIQHIQDQL